MIQVEDEKMIFLDANAFYSYYGRSKLGMTSEPVDEERLKKYLEQQREKSLPTSVYIEIMTHFRNNPKVLQNLLEFRYAKGLPLFNNIPDYVVSEDEITSVAYMDQGNGNGLGPVLDIRNDTLYQNRCTEYSTV